jgi:hypothetical protein
MAGQATGTSDATGDLSGAQSVGDSRFPRAIIAARAAPQAILHSPKLSGIIVESGTPKGGVNE